MFRQPHLLSTALEILALEFIVAKSTEILQQQFIQIRFHFL